MFEEVCPYFLSIGMSYEQFWFKDPHLVKYYADAQKLKEKRRNEELWLQGLYVYNAIGSFAEILPAFPKKGAKVKPYMKEPVSLSEAEWKAKKEREAKIRMETIKQRMIARALEINAKKGGNSNE